MNRIDRLSAILIQLQSKKVVTAQQIADRFDISLRTVYRDIRALEAAGVPLGAEAGVGYFIMEGYNLPPVKFSKEEAGALFMAAKLAEQQTDKSIRKSLEDALIKIRSALKLDEKEFLESIENHIEVLPPPIQSDTRFPDHYLSDIQTALANRRVINFDYYSPYSASNTNRDVEPLSLCFYSRHWHLIGYCKLRKALRDFRSDRIMKLKITSHTFEETIENRYHSLEDLLTRAQDLQEVMVRISKKVAQYISEQKYYMGFVESKSGPANDEHMKFMVGDLEVFAHWLLQFSDEVTVIEPAELRNKVMTLIERAFQHYFKN